MFIVAFGAGGVNVNVFDCAWQPARNRVAAAILTADNVLILFDNVIISPMSQLKLCYSCKLHC